MSAERPHVLVIQDTTIYYPENALGGVNPAEVHMFDRFSRFVHFCRSWPLKPDQVEHLLDNDILRVERAGVSFILSLINKVKNYP